MANGSEFIIRHEFNAPRKLLFKLWTEPKHLNHWWGPVGLKLEVRKMQLRPGGTFLYSMKAPDGNEMFGKFVFREITPPEKIVFVVSFCDEKETPVRHPLSNTWPLEVLSTLLFSEHEGITMLTMKAIPINANDEEVKTFIEGFAGMQQGWTGTLNQLEQYLTKF